MFAEINDLNKVVRIDILFGHVSAMSLLRSCFCIRFSSSLEKIGDDGQGKP